MSAQANQHAGQTLWAGLDIGSTTVKIAIVDPESGELLHGRYQRHFTLQARTALELLDEAHARFAGSTFRVAVCGSGGAGVAERLEAFFIQEVVANAIAVREHYPTTRVAVELGGQDAKVIFFTRDEASGKMLASDMRMNGCCAGGTGAFIDQVAELLRVRVEDFGQLAARGVKVHEISGRCGVFAKTDIQPLLSRGASREDIALSAFHAIAKQTIGGLAQGMEIKPPVLFEGGPLTFNPRLVEVFAERLGLSDDEVLVPERPELMVAWGAALSLGSLFAGEPSRYKGTERLKGAMGPKVLASQNGLEPMFADEAEEADFRRRHPAPTSGPDVAPDDLPKKVEAWLGIDAGSTTVKLVLLDDQGRVLHSFYDSNHGDPLGVLKGALLSARDRFKALGRELTVLGAGSTGYGELLVHRAFQLDFHTVETVAHAEAALNVEPQASFVLDIGGQDMKAISLSGGIVTGITLNEACSAGCGSFLEQFSRGLGVEAPQIAEMAFKAKAPARLGSRCTVFMNSSVVTEQKNGKGREDILAGLCFSLVENLFTKVVRVPSFDALGSHVVVQGGTFKNDAVLRAFEKHTGLTVHRPARPGEMGAIGAALLARKAARDKAAGGPLPASRFLGWQALEGFGWEKAGSNRCPFCTNACERSVLKFSTGGAFVTGNRCERGEVLGDPTDSAVKAKVREAAARAKAAANLPAMQEKRLFIDRPLRRARPEARGLRIGIPRVLQFWDNAPFWLSFFRALGCEPVLSAPNSMALFERGLNYVPSDTACFPAKLAHGALEDLLDKGVDRVFYPIQQKHDGSLGREGAVHMCAVVQGYPIVLKAAHGRLESPEAPAFDSPSFHFHDPVLRERQLVAWAGAALGASAAEVRMAIWEGDASMEAFRAEMRAFSEEAMASLEGPEAFAVVLLGKPYHSDPLVNHHLASHFTRLGVPVLTTDSLPGLEDVDLSPVRSELYNTFQTRIFRGALKALEDPRLELAQVVSFGCGHDAVTTEEITRLAMEGTGRQPLVLKLDEGAAPGPLALRVKSFVETVRARRRAQAPRALGDLPAPFELRFEKGDKARKTILIPNLTPAFSRVLRSVLMRDGYKMEVLPLAGGRAKELGKRYMHNDICYPAQVNIGEMLAALEAGQWDPARVAFGVAKDCTDCRAGQYAALARKALDEAGYPQVPVVTTGKDTKDAYPGFKLHPAFRVRMVWGIALTDALDDMARRLRPYEVEPGSVDKVAERVTLEVTDALRQGHRAALDAFAKAVDAFNAVPADLSRRKPRVLITGEILVKCHPTANEQLVRWLEGHGMETVMPHLVNFFRSSDVLVKEGLKRDHYRHKVMGRLVMGVTDAVYRLVERKVGAEHRRFKAYEDAPDIFELCDDVADMVDLTFVVGEGWLIPAEILSYAKRGVESFITVQPFACLPNHISGRGLARAIKQRHPQVTLLSLDYDPDTALANVENRLQMLVLAAREREQARQEAAAG